MALFKDELGPHAAHHLAEELTRAWPAFPSDRFLDGIDRALAPLELTPRVRHLAERLATALPSAFPDAAPIVWRALDAPTFTGWITLPCGTWVADRGLDHPEAALPLLAGLSPRFSSEGPMRPFIEQHPALTFDHLRRWAVDPNEHVRRLVSECTRPRLPWAPLLRAFIADPSPTLPLLDALVDDPSAYVRRSVANHLNDIAKDHPDVAIAAARRWHDRGDGAAWVVRHGLRTLVKRGHPDALALLGADQQASFTLTGPTLERDRIAIGEEAVFSFTLGLTGDEPADAVIDYRVHYVGARGIKAPKVFKLTRRTLNPGAPIAITRRHRFEHVSIRRIHPGAHTIDVQVNGRVLGAVVIDVSDASAPDMDDQGSPSAR